MVPLGAHHLTRAGRSGDYGSGCSQTSPTGLKRGIRPSASTCVVNGSSTLGPETCTAATLELRGVSGCPANSIVGTGKALISVKLGPEYVNQTVSLVILMGPPKAGQSELLFFSTGTTAVIKAVFPDAAGPLGTPIEATVPPIPTLPGSPDAALIGMSAQIAPKGLTYHKLEQGVSVPYTPKGFDTPPKCPRGGFRFGATFTFSAGAREAASTRVPCPRAGGSTSNEK